MKEYSYGICPYFIEDNNIYIVLCKANKPDNYGFFKGKNETNESIYETAVREFKEEAGIQLNIKKLEDYFYTENKKKNIGIFLYEFHKSDLKKIIVDRKEIYSFDYFGINDINSNEILNNQKLIFNSITTFLTIKRTNLRKFRTRKKIIKKYQRR